MGLKPSSPSLGREKDSTQSIIEMHLLFAFYLYSFSEHQHLTLMEPFSSLHDPLCFWSREKEIKAQPQSFMPLIHHLRMLPTISLLKDTSFDI